MRMHLDSKKKEEARVEANARLRILQQVTESVHSSLDLDKVLKQITDGVVHSLGYNTAVIFMLDNKKKNFEVKIVSTKKRLLYHINKILGFPLKELSIPADSELSPAIRAAMEGQVVVAKNLVEIGYPSISKKTCSMLQKLIGTKSYIVVPLKVENEVVGGVLITSPNEDVSEEELTALKSFAYAASNAVKNAKIHLKTRQAEEALRKSEMIYRALFEHASDAVFLMNLEGAHITVNKKAADMLGYSIKELIGKSYKEIVAPGEYENATDKLQGLLEGKSFHSYERIFRKKDGTEFPVEINVALVRDPENRPLFIQSIVRDITQRKKAEERIKASLREKEILLREVHHRVKNNMQIILSLHKLQSKNIKNERILEIFSSTQNRIKSMALIHERLYQSEDLARIDLAEYVKRLTGYLSSSYRISPSAVKFKIDIKNVFLDINKAIPFGLIINELVSNSLKYAFPNEKKGEIKIAVHPLNGKEAELIVSDNGLGLPENIDFRNTKSLGLHLVTILAEDQLHGVIRLDRKEGTSFHISLKLKK
jgi:PAS domain S-box-containing protein